MKQSNDMEDYCMELVSLADLINNYGAVEILLDLRQNFPEEFRALQLALLETLPK
jgi:hypothetical protein